VGTIHRIPFGDETVGLANVFKFDWFSKLPIGVKREIAIGIGLVLTTVITVLCIVDACTKPPTRLQYWGDRGDKVIIDVATLGEYPTTIVHARLTNRQTHAIIWEIKTNSGTPQIHAMALREGENSVSLVEPDSGTYAVVSPPNLKIFRLEHGVEYELELWGGANSSPARVEIRFGRR
jgi:hypothetical protein